ncbi:MAG: hypothetical protein K8T26_09710 [Lentisphaerae bacterium]|nr:hypothetical protein [Lentisphaerota bacterium]
MSKSKLWALVVIGVTVVVLLLTRGKADVPLVFWTLDNIRAAFVYLGFTVVGVVIGVLLK